MPVVALRRKARYIRAMVTRNSAAADFWSVVFTESLTSVTSPLYW